MKKYVSLFIIVSLLVSQLNVAAQKYVASEVEYGYTAVTKQEITDSSILKFLKPYRDSMSKVMSQVIGFATVTLYYKQPESPIANFLADAMKVMGEEKFKRKIDVAIINAGGIRSYLPKGEITLQNVFEIMPYDNLIILQEVKGATLKKFLDFTASKGGWGVSGIKMQIKDHKADSVFINGKLLDENATYIVANTDYVAKGGDNTKELKDIPQISIGYLYREAITEYIQQFTKKGKPVTAAIEGRIVNVE
jgi:2',3'-cyclic-nucleotide 2'-phosphodiesterase (5'-nucleotidase family)